MKGLVHMNMNFKRLLAIGLAVIFLLPSKTIWANEKTAYETLAEARAITHKDGPFNIRGEAVATASETINGKLQVNNKNYRITGYDIHARETLLSFETVAFLLKPEAVYIKENENAWKPADLMVLLPKFISMGILDQFFLLEILNSDRLDWYADYMVFGEPDTITVTVSRTQFAELAGKLTEDITALLGEAFQGMSELQLMLLQRFIRGIFIGLEAEGMFTFYIDPATGRITQTKTQMEMTDPYGSRVPGANPKVKSQANWYLIDFGPAIEPVNVSPATPKDPQ
jgi:hypothetical protein